MRWETSIHPRRHRRTPCVPSAQIEVWRETVIDLDTIVDDKRRALDRALLELRVAVRDRDRAVTHLAHLIDLALHSAAEQPAA